MKSHRYHLLIAAVALLVTLAAVPASAQVTYDAEIDCGGVWSPGQAVPFTVRFEEQAFVSHDINVTIAVTIPGRGQHTLFQGTMLLGPNEDRSFVRDLNLPMGAPNGSYQMSVTADDGSQMAFDTCSFNVQ